MTSSQPTLTSNYVPAVCRDDLVNVLRLIQHATAPDPDDGGYHENAYALASQILSKVDAHLKYRME